MMQPTSMWLEELLSALEHDFASIFARTQTASTCSNVIRYNSETQAEARPERSRDRSERVGCSKTWNQLSSMKVTLYYSLMLSTGQSNQTAKIINTHVQGDQTKDDRTEDDRTEDDQTEDERTEDDQTEDDRTEDDQTEEG